MTATTEVPGRWTVFVCEACSLATGRHKECDNAHRAATPVVPCDTAALERAAMMLSACDGCVWEPESRDADWYRGVARRAFRAAGETP